jgi:hypothetical protein
MPLDNLSNTMRVFLGARMECAQCHDDPFGTTERHDFYQLAAFTHGQGRCGQNSCNRSGTSCATSDTERREYRVAQSCGMAFTACPSAEAAGQHPAALDYQYRDAAPAKSSEPARLLENRPHVRKTGRGSDGREKLAEWVVGRTEGQFPSVIANRMWKRVMGKGFYEPVDEYVPAAKTPSAALVSYISELMVELKYDLRAFQHVLSAHPHLPVRHQPESLDRRGRR